MKKKKHNKLIISFIIVLTLLIISFSTILLLGYIFPKLSSFKIVKISEEKDKLYIKVTDSYNAVSYEVNCIDESGNIVYKKEGKNSKIDISDLILGRNQKVKFKVIAKNRKKQTLESKNTLKYQNKEASFANLKDHYVKQDQTIKFLVYDFKENEKYEIKLFYGNKAIKNLIINNSIINIDYDDVKDYQGKVTAKLYNKNKRVISLLNIYINTVEIADLKIDNVPSEHKMYWDDLTLKYSGGDNANTVLVKVYNGKKIVYSYSQDFNKKEIVIPASTFRENTKYTVSLFATYNDYMEIAKSANMTVEVLEKSKVKPVYVNKNYTFIKKGTKVKLSTDTKETIIYYTTDGSKPTRDSNVYNGEITIDNDVTIKAFAIRNNYEDSEVNTYNFTVRDKDLVVYLSPSNQYDNHGVSDVGYTTEKNEMNDLANYIEKYLKEAGVTVYRNVPTAPGGINTWLAQSKRYGSDFHFAIHSNGSVNHDTNGMEIYVDKETSPCLSIASNIYKNLYAIYPYQSFDTDRGVKYANGALGEANDNFIKCGSLIEVAYHDDYNDAKWIMENKNAIGKNIAQSIIDFYGVKD